MNEFDYIGYVSAWLKYISKVFETAGGLADTIRGLFANIRIPKKSDYERPVI